MLKRKTEGGLKNRTDMEGQKSPIKSDDTRMPKDRRWDSFMKAIDMFSEDFMEEGRADQGVQVREAL